MTVQRTKFQPPPRSARASKARIQLVPINRGFNPSVDALQLGEGEAAFMQNMTLREGYVEPRSGLSQPDALEPAVDQVDYMARTFDTSKEHLAVIGETEIHRTTSGQLFSYTTLTGPSLTSINPIASTLDAYWDSTNAYDATTRNNLFVFTNGSEAANHPMVHNTQGTSYITLDSFLSSGESRAYLVESFDDRLVFFKSVDSKGTLNNTRVRWSVRGNPSDLSNAGAGFEDLFDMSGSGTGLVAESGRLLLMSETEVWQATPRRDAFAFDFNALDTSIGCQIPRSVAKTPVGVFFISGSLILYRVAGSTIRPVSRKIVNFLQDASATRQIWCSYNDVNRSLWIFFSKDERTSLDQGTDQAIEIYIDTLEPQNNGSDDFEFVFHKFNNLDLVHGAQFFYADDYNSDVRGGSSLVVGSSKGTVYQFRSDQTTDSGTTFAAIWQSPKLKGRDPNNKEGISEVWFDTGFESILGRSNRASTNPFSSRTATLEFYTSIDQGATFSNTGSVSINTIDSLNTTSKFTTAFLAVTPQATAHPQFEVRVLDGSRPRLAAARLTLNQFTGRF